MSEQIEKHLVEAAIKALSDFVSKYAGNGVRVSDGIAKWFRLAWRNQGVYMWWTSCRGFRRIDVVPLNESLGFKCVAMVYSAHEVNQLDQALTEELNKAIFLATKGEWLPK